MQIPALFRPVRSKYLVFTADYLIPALISLFVIFSIYLVLYSPFFNITQVVCSLDYQPCQDPTLLVELDKLNGQNIFRLSKSDLIKRFTSGDFTISGVVVTKKLPSTVSLDMQSVYPVVALRVDGDSKWVVMDSQYRVIATRDTDPNVPTVILSGAINLNVGKPPKDDLVLEALGLALRISDELFSVKSITLIDENTVELSLDNGIKALLTPKKDELSQVKVLQAILGDATMIKGIRSIDVRFARPVLRP